MTKYKLYITGGMRRMFPLVSQRMPSEGKSIPIPLICMSIFLCKYCKTSGVNTN